MAVTSTTKACTKCRRELPLSGFHRNSAQPGGRHSICRDCKNSAAAGYYQRWSPEQRALHRSRVLRSRYGIEYDFVKALYERQEGCCAICGTPGEMPASPEKRKAPKGVLCVDHSHETGEVRGLLCRPCNQGLGYFSDDVVRMAAAMSYLLRGGE